MMEYHSKLFRQKQHATKFKVILAIGVGYS